MDGPEGCGKSTQAQKLAEFFRQQGGQVELVREPGGTEAGKEIRKLLLQSELDLSPLTEALLFFADRAQLLEEVIKPALQKRRVVISDRGYPSTYAYQVAGGKLSPEIVEKLTGIVLGDFLPDAVVILDLSPEEGFGRKKGPSDRIERKSKEFHSRVREGFLEWAKKQEGKARPKVAVIDASQSPDSVFREILAFLQKHHFL
ncbi:dTMP kinase [bacterium]|nr:dTMP kinase [bacterium]